MRTARAPRARHAGRAWPREVAAPGLPRRQPVWLFDLDNTLHHASHAIFPQINRLMTAYVARVLGTDEATASRVRVDYWRRYGATILGMVRHHDVDPDDFLAQAHRFDDLRAMVRAERGLAQLLRALPGRKILLTNAPAAYAREVVRHIGLRRAFAREIAVEHMWVHRRLRPKPDPLMLRRLLARERIAPSRAILVEDTLSHLKRYRRLGLSTVWVTGYLRRVAPGVVPAAAADALHPMQAAALGARANSPQRQPAAPILFANRPGYVSVKVKSVLQLQRRLVRHGRG
ncbi:pyrimidine 5'-nucleotidase [Ralstonia sp. SM1864_UCD524_TZ4]|uniref:Putative had-superfamily hydrolase subfamily ia, variant 3 protein n=3 Tax=Ralstonia solanacearum species complex TaxID=3116862 RepID=A0A0S4VN12_RALSL|nr:pyrimidine 5'-nucleotidase [Ralstonia pseudosolanacearum]CUV21509.1 putative had-superfamily hydrolase subfamily ia, variant 3 protein [Ralstonia solanacearum]CUV35661.1 putative had-superfamily hydrolase subfamily ia, variant 3 protein [Ralstonia solanacearum]CUV40516.1 putative had-superfamily hydrolase subfamily ia, variant 3 protein [Ralstonia solanacearum]CUV60329.1 putative had-superfamily hydrolase subfamily ia, variant 3 protein [Ralstonia solanacearum]